MRNLTLLLLSLLALGAAVKAGAQSAQSAQPPVGFSLAISARQATTKSGEPVAMQLIFTNVSTSELATEPWGDVYFELSVRDSGGNSRAPKAEEKKLLPPGEFVIPRRGGPVHFLLPGESETVDFELGKRFRHFLNEPGKYTIQAQRYDEQSKTMVKSNVITVTVTQ